MYFAIYFLADEPPEEENDHHSVQRKSFATFFLNFSLRLIDSYTTFQASHIGIIFQKAESSSYFFSQSMRVLTSTMHFLLSNLSRQRDGFGVDMF